MSRGPRLTPHEAADHAVELLQDQGFVLDESETLDMSGELRFCHKRVLNHPTDPVKLVVDVRRFRKSSMLTLTTHVLIGDPGMYERTDECESVRGKWEFRAESVGLACSGVGRGAAALLERSRKTHDAAMAAEQIVIDYVMEGNAHWNVKDRPSTYTFQPSPFAPGRIDVVLTWDSMTPEQARRIAQTLRDAGLA